MLLTLTQFYWDKILSFTLIIMKHEEITQAGSFSFATLKESEGSISAKS